MCGSCERYQVSCIYGYQNSPASEPSVAEPRGPLSELSVDKDTIGDDPAADNLPESKERRILELKLLHHYLVKTSCTLLEPTEQAGKDLWTIVFPGLAFKHDALLYLIYAIAALHLSRTTPTDGEALDAYRQYLNLALHRHHRDISRLSKANADIICLTSSLIRVDAFAQLQERPLDPYTPPSQWLQLTKGAGAAYRAAWNHIRADDNSIAVRLLKRTPAILETNQLFGVQNRQGLLHLLQQTPVKGTISEPWDTEIQEAYESTCSYIGSVQIAIKENETLGEICRRLLLFPILIRSRFIQLVGEQQPRALVILAHFFALIARFRDLWWIGDTGQREIFGIQSVLPPEWQYLMSWPLHAMYEKFDMEQKAS